VSTARFGTFGVYGVVIPGFHTVNMVNWVDGTVEDLEAYGLQIFIAQFDNVVKPFGVDRFLSLLEQPILFLDNLRADRAQTGAVTLQALLKRDIKKKKLCTDSVLPTKVQERPSRHGSYGSCINNANAVDGKALTNEKVQKGKSLRMVTLVRLVIAY
jgi:hypothetical protein